MRFSTYNLLIRQSTTYLQNRTEEKRKASHDHYAARRGHTRPDGEQTQTQTHAITSDEVLRMLYKRLGGRKTQRRVLTRRKYHLNPNPLHSDEIVAFPQVNRIQQGTIRYG